MDIFDIVVKDYFFDINDIFNDNFSNTIIIPFFYILNIRIFF